MTSSTLHRAACSLGLAVLLSTTMANAEVVDPIGDEPAQVSRDEAATEAEAAAETVPVEESPSEEVAPSEVAPADVAPADVAPAEVTPPAAEPGVGEARLSPPAEPALQPALAAEAEAVVEATRPEPRAVERVRRGHGAGLVLTVLGGVAAPFGVAAILISDLVSQGLLWTGVSALAVGVGLIVTGVVLLVRGRRRARELFSVETWSEARDRLREPGHQAAAPAEPVLAEPLGLEEVEAVRRALQPQVQRCVTGSEPPPALVLQVELDGMGQVILHSVAPSAPEPVLICLTRATATAQLRATNRPPIRLEWTFSIGTLAPE